MITAEEFFRNKIKELQPNKEVITLSQELITAEQGMRWAHEFKQQQDTDDLIGYFFTDENNNDVIVLASDNDYCMVQELGKEDPYVIPKEFVLEIKAGGEHV